MPSGLEVRVRSYGGRSFLTVKSGGHRMRVEVEFESAAAAAGSRPPAWLGREVTDDPAYKNQRLAIEGVPASHPA